MDLERASAAFLIWRWLRHHGLADASYLGTYGIGGVWTGWLISSGAGHIVAGQGGI